MTKIVPDPPLTIPEALCLPDLLAVETVLIVQ